MTDRSPTDWHEWHRAYDDPDSVLSRRLVIVQRELAAALDRAATGEIRVLSMCAGDGRDLLGVLQSHARASDVVGVLVELDPALSTAAATAAARGGHAALQCVQGDAGVAAHYAEVAPVDVALACGVFGNLADDDVHRTVRALSALTAVGGSVVWTRHRRQPDLTDAIRTWFTESGFEELGFEQVARSSSSVGTHRLVRRQTALVPSRMFEFVGDGSAAHL